MGKQSKKNKSKQSSLSSQFNQKQDLTASPKTKHIYKQQSSKTTKNKVKIKKQKVNKQSRVRKSTNNQKYFQSEKQPIKKETKARKIQPNYYMAQVNYRNNHRQAICTVCRKYVNDTSWETHSHSKLYYTNAPLLKTKLKQMEISESDQQYWSRKQCFACNQKLIKSQQPFPIIKFCIYCFSAIHNQKDCLEKTKQLCLCYQKHLKLVQKIEPQHFVLQKTKSNTVYLGLKSYKIKNKNKEKENEHKQCLKQIQDQLKLRGQISTKNVFWKGYKPAYSLNKQITFLSKKDSKIVQQYLSYLTKVPIKMISMKKQQYGKDIVALQDIQKNVYICQYSGDIIPIQYAKLAHSYVMNYLQGFKSKDQYIIAPIIHWSLGNLFNHSDQPNIQVFRCIVNNQPAVLIYTIKNIKAGTSLRYNYNGNSTTQHFYDVNFQKR